MGIKIEFNPDLALRAFGTINKAEEECLPKKSEIRKIYNFLKKGQRNYWLEGEIPLLETKGNSELSRPLASIKILETTHIIIKKIIYTKGKYQIIEVFDNNDKKIHFEGFNKIR